ncbi:unnamed protein product [Vicia faba]|uniref:Uncharacterized protein n=1 Tax=Vicia faba TaxID=3906 RepID=A0AAV1ALL7_VICFA|nr:unnamed protein product [Vicia faba]
MVYSIIEEQVSCVNPMVISRKSKRCLEKGNLSWSEGDFLSGHAKVVFRGPITFDEACLKLKNQKPKKKKIKFLKDIHHQEVAQSTYFAIIQPIKGKSADQSQWPEKASRKCMAVKVGEDLSMAFNSLRTNCDQPSSSSDDLFSEGAVLCCDSTTLSDVNQGNNKFWENMESEVGRIVWETVSRLGITIDIDKVEAIEAIKIMENRDKEGMNRKEAKKHNSS